MDFRKLINVSLLILLLSIAVIVIKNEHDLQCHSETYSGVIVERGKEQPNGYGYKSHTDTKYYFMYREDNSQKVIRVDVLIPDWYSKKDGDRVSYKISNIQMKKLGNTSDAGKNLFGK